MTNSKRVFLDKDLQPTPINPCYVKKTVINPKYSNLANNEAYWLRRLAHLDWVPKVLEYDECTILMTYAGKEVNAHTLPEDWREQTTRMLLELEEAGCCHNDIKAGELLVKDGKLQLIDFQHATNTREEFKAKKKSGECQCRMSWTDHDAMINILSKMEKKK